jgi:quercetin dioxygenase-like cupin family protein
MNRNVPRREAAPDPDLQAALLQALEPAAPAGAARIKRRLLARVAADAAPPRGVRALRHADGWQPFLPGAQRKILFDDGETMTSLVRLQAGAALPPHRHDDGDEECVVLEGTLRVNGVSYGPGDFSLARRGSAHLAVSTDSGALFLLRSTSRHARPDTARPRA